MNKIYQKIPSYKKTPLGGSFNGVIPSGRGPGFFPYLRSGGFTLTEVLVAVVIVGILTAVALPQYRKSVWKSRAAELLVRARSIRLAQNAYYMANGNYALHFGELDIKLPEKASSSASANCNLTATDVSNYGMLQSVISSPDAGGSGLVFNLFREGPYACAGYVYIPGNVSYAGVMPDNVYCVERDAVPFPGKRGDFCRRLLGASYAASIWRWSFYRLP